MNTGGEGTVRSSLLYIEVYVKEYGNLVSNPVLCKTGYKPELPFEHEWGRNGTVITTICIVTNLADAIYCNTLRHFQ